MKLGIAATASVIATLAGCGSDDATSNNPPPPPPGQVVVSSVSPEQVVTGDAVQVTIRGSGFDAGSTVSFEVGNQPAPEVSVTGVRFVSPTEMTATVSVRGGTPTRRYAVVIRTGRGTRGVGNESTKLWNRGFEELGVGWALRCEQWWHGRRVYQYFGGGHGRGVCLGPR